MKCRHAFSFLMLRKVFCITICLIVAFSCVNAYAGVNAGYYLHVLCRSKYHTDSIVRTNDTTRAIATGAILNETVESESLYAESADTVQVILEAIEYDEIYISLEKLKKEEYSWASKEADICVRLYLFGEDSWVVITCPIVYDQKVISRWDYFGEAFNREKEKKAGFKRDETMSTFARKGDFVYYHVDASIVSTMMKIEDFNDLQEYVEKALKKEMR